MGSPVARKVPFIRTRYIPDLLTSFDHWLVWKYRDNPRPGKKPLKVPYYVDGGKRAGDLGGEADVARLADFDTAVATAKTRGFDGVGLAVMGSVQDITVLDLDDCIDDKGTISEFGQEIISTGTYVERSPSGRGLRAVFSGAVLGDTKRNFRIDNGERVEVYCGGAYTTFTGNRVSDESGVLPMPKLMRRRLRAGMEQSGLSADAPGGGSEVTPGNEGLASLNAVALPNMTPAQALRVLKGLPAKWGEPESGTWFQVAAALHMQFDGSDEGYEVLDAWSQRIEGYDPEGNRARWDAGFSHDRGKQNVLSMRNLVFEARDAGAKFKQETLRSWGLARAAEDRAAEDDIELPEDPLKAEIARAWTPVDISQWGTPQRPEGAKALIRNWLYEGAVTLFSSNGGGGKSYIVLSLAALAALPADPDTGELRQWFNQSITPGRVLYVSGEDPLPEVHHRLWGLCAAYGISMQALAGRLDIVDVTPVLHKALYTAGTDFGKTEFTKQYAKMKSLIETNGYKYVIIDNLAKFYMANENARPMVDEFVSALAAMAAANEASVLLVGHSAKLGGEGYSGSTAWHNSARARWTLTVKDGTRNLVVEKNNYGETGHGGYWGWDGANHVLRMQQSSGPGSAAEEFQDVELIEGMRRVVLDLYEGGTSTWRTRTGPIGPIEQNPWVLENQLDTKMIREILERCVTSGLLEVEKYNDTRRNKVRERYAPLEQDILG